MIVWKIQGSCIYVKYKYSQTVAMVVLLPFIDRTSNTASNDSVIAIYACLRATDPLLDHVCKYEPLIAS